MAKGNIVRWITIKGRRIPIYEDGSMGGFMEGKEAVGNHKREDILSYAKKQGVYSDIKKELGDKDTFTDKEVEDAIKRAGASSQMKGWNEKKEEFISNKGSYEDTIARDAKKFQEDPRVAMKEGWGNGYYQEIKEYIDSQKKKKEESTNEKGLKSLEDHSDIQRIADEYDKKEKEDFVVDYKIPDDPDYEKKRMAREIADENDAYDREHKEGKYSDTHRSKTGPLAYMTDDQVMEAAIKRAEGRVKDSKNTLAEREGKSINVGGKKVGVNKGVNFDSMSAKELIELDNNAWEMGYNKDQLQNLRWALESKGYIYEDGRWKKKKKNKDIWSSAGHPG